MGVDSSVGFYGALRLCASKNSISQSFVAEADSCLRYGFVHDILRLTTFTYSGECAIVGEY
jgi:hypothetical protein